MSNAVRSGVVTASAVENQDLVVKQSVAPSDDATWRPRVGVDEFHRRVGINPILDPCTAAAARPAIVACRRDQSHAATIRC